jgi:PAS domain S-box-containing protein
MTQNLSLKENILIVDDTPDNLNLLSEILTERGYKVRPAPSGKLALRFIQSTLPDLILLDIKMPEMDGYEVCKQLKASKRTQDIPVIFISALNEVFDKVKAFSLGAADYITKPFEPQEVLARVENQLRISRLSKQLLDQNVKLSEEIEERKRVEEALQQKNELLQTIFDHMPVMVTLYDANGRIQFVNRESERMMGWSPSELKEIDLLAECCPDSEQRQKVLDHMRRATGKWLDHKVRTKDDRSVDTSWANIRLSNGMSIGLGQDITARKQAEEASVLAERNRMAQEIHDTLAQAFTGIIVHLQAASRKIATDPETAQACITTGGNLARSGLAEARRSVAALRPELLEDGDLYSALHRLSTQMFSHTNIHIVCEVIGETYPLPNDVENNLLRIGQEALTNAFKYAKASEIRIELVYETEQFVLRVKDNGQGFEITSNLSVGNGFGLLGMSQRAERIGAQLAIHSQLGQGTEIVVSVNQG